MTKPDQQNPANDQTPTKNPPHSAHALHKFLLLERRNGEEWEVVRLVVDGKRRIWCPIEALAGQTLAEFAEGTGGPGLYRVFHSPKPSRQRALAGPVFEVQGVEAGPQEPEPDYTAADEVRELREQLDELQRQNDQMSLGHWERMRALAQADAGLVVAQLVQMHEAHLAQIRAQAEIDIATLRARQEEDRGRNHEHYQTVLSLREAQSAPEISRLAQTVEELRGDLEDVNERADREAEERDQALKQLAEAKNGEAPDFAAAVLAKVAEDPQGAMAALKQVLTTITGSQEAAGGGTLTG